MKSIDERYRFSLENLKPTLNKNPKIFLNEPSYQLSCRDRWMNYVASWSEYIIKSTKKAQQ
jgi:hypothetical protein